MTDDQCGELTADGSPCKRSAGFGTERDHGPCRDHAESYRVPRKLTEEVKQTIIGAKRRGAWDWMAAEMAKIDPNTLSNWKMWAQEAIDDGVENELTEFYLDFTRAEAAGGVEKLGEVDAEWLLERKYGYTKTEEHDVKHSGEGDDGEILVDFGDVDT